MYLCIDYIGGIVSIYNKYFLKFRVRFDVYCLGNNFKEKLGYFLLIIIIY